MLLSQLSQGHTDVVYQEWLHLTRDEQDAWQAAGVAARDVRAGRGESKERTGTMSERPICDTPGCGREIPKGGEGHPEICPTCLDQLAHDDKVKSEAVSEYRARLLKVAEKALKHRKKADEQVIGPNPEGRPHE
jgi:hypothetical protein